MPQRPAPLSQDENKRHRRAQTHAQTTKHIPEVAKTAEVFLRTFTLKRGEVANSQDTNTEVMKSGKRPSM